MGLLTRIAISNGNQERKDEATRLLKEKDKKAVEQLNKHLKKGRSK